MNESILYNVDTLHNAIAANRRITFRYFDYNIKREKVFRKNGELYSADPLALTFDNENYYLISYHHKYEGYVHYRVDKMTDIHSRCFLCLMVKSSKSQLYFIYPI